jgi:hypothetical protein
MPRHTALHEAADRFSAQDFPYSQPLCGKLLAANSAIDKAFADHRENAGRASPDRMANVFVYRLLTFGSAGGGLAFCGRECLFQSSWISTQQ